MLDINKIKRDIRSEKWKLLGKIDEDIQAMKVGDKISEINDAIKQMKGRPLQLNLEEADGEQLDLLESSKDEPLGVLLQALWLLKHKPAEGAPATKQDQERKGATPRSHQDIIKETAKRLKKHMEEEDAHEKLKPKEKASAKPIRLMEAHYEHILREVFPPVTSKKAPQIQEQDSNQATAIGATSTIILAEDQIKGMIRRVLQATGAAG